VRDQFEISLVDESNSSCLEEEQEAASAVMRLYCRLVEGIETQGENLGKEGKLQLLICLAAR
jgi:hypothetical protein